jgi:phage terminase large subunit-like protein
VNDDELLVKKLYEYGKRVATGEVVDDTFLFEWYEADEAIAYEQLADDATFELAVSQANPAMGDFADLAATRQRYHAIPRADFERYYLNRFVTSEEVWAVAAVWDDLADASVDLDPELPLFVGIDVGLRHDASAVVAAQLLADERVVVRAWVWENPYEAADPRHDEWKLNTREVGAVLRELFAGFPVPAGLDKDDRPLHGPVFFYDQHFFETEADDLAQDGLNMLDYPQSDERMIPAAQAMYQLCVEGRLVHDGHPGLARHVKSVVPHERTRGWRISKPKGSRVHIDGAIACALAVLGATRPKPEPVKPALYV